MSLGFRPWSFHRVSYEVGKVLTILTDTFSLYLEYLVLQTFITTQVSFIWVFHLQLSRDNSK